MRADYIVVSASLSVEKQMCEALWIVRTTRDVQVPNTGHPLFRENWRTLSEAINIPYNIHSLFPVIPQS